MSDKNDFLVFTCNYGDGDISLLRESCDRLKVPFAVYGEGQAWPGFVKAKIEGALEFLKGRTEDWVVYTDGHDSFFGPNLEPLLYIPFVTVSAETNCWPDPYLDKVYKNKEVPQTPWCFVNAGSWCGSRMDLIALLDRLLSVNSKYNEDDQRLWTWAYLNSQRIILDRHCFLFQTLGGNDPIDWRTGLNTLTGSSPSVFHFNGRTPGMRERYAELWKGK